MLNLAEDSTIITKTKELCQTILDEPEFKDLQNSVKDFLGNDAAKAQYQEFAHKTNEFHNKHHRGEDIPPNEIDEYEAMRSALFENPSTKSFIEVQEAVGQLQKKLQDYVTMTVEFGRVPVADDFVSECCKEGNCGC